MNRLPRIAPWVLFALAAALCAAVCHQRLIPTIPTVSAAVAAAQDQAPPDQGPDPAAVNLAPSGPSYTTEAPPPSYQSSGTAAEPEDSNYADQPVANASEPPPPLPDYVQPPCPGDGYMWEPGYWGWSPSGYYWVPGAWVEAPYMGALWTPGYWGFYTGRYWFHPGHWGSHIGYYGGINYGFGYVGFGYEGGYWNGGRFTYNRIYSNVNERRVHNVYRYNAGNRAFANREPYNRESSIRENNNSRASFHGGTGGTQVRPQASDAAAWREPTASRMSTQVQHEQRFQSNRGQFANTNHGQPAKPAVSRPIRADRNVQPTTRNQSHSGQQQEHHR
ncbi:MAG: YXWGXW repeat-containing protein [Terracidiphilus sp.]|nr:YXWGXW repeat-containing protein [Terracidiphilus sp.]